MKDKLSKIVDITLLCTFILILIMYSTGCKKTEPAKTDESNELIDVRIGLVDKLTIKDKIKVTGSLIPFERVIISNKNPGKVISYYVDLGDYVKKGQLLAQINPLQIGV